MTSAGWRPHAQQVGQTGTRIAPDLYIACGISGAIQHMVGCRSAKAILAINTDRDAPMVTRATYAVIGDLHAVLPAIISAIKAVPLGPSDQRPVARIVRRTDPIPVLGWAAGADPACPNPPDPRRPHGRHDRSC